MTFSYHGLAIAALLPQSALKGALQMDELKCLGKAVGLTDEQIRETIDAWVGWYRTTPRDLDFRRIRTAITDRASGLEWRPPNLRPSQPESEPLP